MEDFQEPLEWSGPMPSEGGTGQALFSTLVQGVTIPRVKESFFSKLFFCHSL